jgi:hypothetical protein
MTWYLYFLWNLDTPGIIGNHLLNSSFLFNSEIFFVNWNVFQWLYTYTVSVSFLSKKIIVNYCHFKIFIIETFVRDVQIIQKFKIIHVFESSYEWKTYYWLHLKFVRVGKLCESVCISKKKLLNYLSGILKWFEIKAC